MKATDNIGDEIIQLIREASARNDLVNMSIYRERLVKYALEHELPPGLSRKEHNYARTGDTYAAYLDMVRKRSR